ncbi:MAG: esterase [Bacteroidetes bacterium]|nr:esterase [Bacteroidota bacterium]
MCQRQKRVIQSLCVTLFLCLSLGSCGKADKMPPIDNNKDLDGKLVNDSSLSFPQNYLLSAAVPVPSAGDLAKPAVILVHGFSATTFEWLEFRDWVKTKGDVHTSLVLLGGHGRDYADFKKATWQDWQQPIIDEYQKLQNFGYKIHIVASSTGCPLVLNMLRENKVNPALLNQLILIDPIIIPANKQLSLIPALGAALPYTETEMEKGEDGFWYKYRPAEALQQLEKLARRERKALETGYTLNEGISVKVYKSIKDAAVDPLSAVQLRKGLRHAKGSEIEVEMVESNLHVFTRLRGRNSFTSEDSATQVRVFQEIYNRVK